MFAIYAFLLQSSPPLDLLPRAAQDLTVIGVLSGFCVLFWKALERERVKRDVDSEKVLQAFLNHAEAMHKMTGTLDRIREELEEVRMDRANRRP